MRSNPRLPIRDKATVLRCTCQAELALKPGERLVQNRALAGGVSSAEGSIEARHCPTCNRRYSVEVPRG